MEIFEFEKQDGIIFDDNKIHTYASIITNDKDIKYVLL